MDGHDQPVPPDRSDWPWWLTLGGDTGRSAAGSDWVAGSNFVLCLGLWAVCAAIGLYWFRQASAAKSEVGRRIKLDMGALFAGGGFVAFALPCLMMWLPWWSLLLAGRAAMLVLAVKTVVDVRHIVAAFTLDERVRSRMASVAGRLEEIASPQAAAVDRAALREVAAQLARLSRED